MEEVQPQPHFNKKWAPEHDEMLKNLLLSNFSFSHAAAAINAGHGTAYSRNAAIGRAHRLGLANPVPLAVKASRRAERAKQNGVVTKIARARPRAEPRFKAEPAPTSEPYSGSLRLSLVDLLPGQCHFPEGDEPPFAFCGNPTADGTSWCHHHQQIVWVKPEHRRAVSAEGNRRGPKVSNIVGSYEAA